MKGAEKMKEARYMDHSFEMESQSIADNVFGWDWTLKPVKGNTVWTAEHSWEHPIISDAAILELFDIPEWSIDAELLLMNWRS